MDVPAFLNTPLNSLGLSDQFCDESRVLGFNTIGSIVGVPLEEIITMEGFNYHWLAELSEALNKEGLLHLLQPLPGSIPG
jgi:hypothetical protein